MNKPPQKPAKKRPLPPPRVDVLIIASPDGFLEIYGPRQVQIHIATRLHVADQEQNQADEYLLLSLPPRIRELYTTAHLRKTHLIERQTAAMEADRRHNLESLQAVREFGRAMRGGKKA
jgi:hypothetical protein